MKDINGVKIKEGMLLKTTQHPGGILPPAGPKIGIVEKTKNSFGKDSFQIRYRNSYGYDSLILLDGQINEVIEQPLQK